MELVANLQLGFGEALSFQNLLYCGLGALIGTLIGVLPGIGPIATVSMLLPLTYGMTPSGALIMLAGIYYGAQYGGSTTAILVRLPGEAASVVTCIDGNEMAVQGRAGPALAIAAIGSFIAGTVGTLILAALASPMTALALKFGSAEYFSLMVFGLVASIALGSGSILKSLPMIFIGVFLGLVGTDVNTGAQRYVFGFPDLWEGINFVALAMGLFGLADIINDLANPEPKRGKIARITSLMPTRADLRRSWGAIARGTSLGALLGTLPGGGATLASFSAYALEKRVSKTPERFGHGAIEGVAAPESANNAAAQTAFIPMLSLGVPANALMALLIGALIIQGIQPGPQVMAAHPALFWGLIASMWIGNVMLLVINLPLVGIWVKLLKIPYRMLFKIIMVLSCIGVFSLNNSTFDIYVLGVFGLLGYFFIKTGAEPTPLILGYVLGPLLEQNAQRALLSAEGNPLTFLHSPISAGFLLGAMALLAVILFLGSPPQEKAS